MSGAATDVIAAPGGKQEAVEGLVVQARRLHEAQRHAEAAALVRRALEIDPADADLWNTCAVFLRAGAQSAEAVWLYRRALALEPANAGFWSNLGNALKDTKQVDTAIRCHRRAIALEPDNAGFHRNLALALITANRPREAVDSFNQALSLEPANRGIRFDRGMAYLCLGDLERGWADYETRLHDLDIARQPPGRLWGGQPYPGQRLLIVSEQGHGDALWAARYFQRAKALGGELVVECLPALASLFETIPEIDRIIRRGERLPNSDFHCYLCSLPGPFTPTLDAVPAAPYLAAPAERLAKFAPVMARAGGALRVGIVWSGNLEFIRNKDRATPLRAFMQAFAHPGVQLYSLQKGPLEEDLRSLSKDAPIIDLAPLINDFADSAAAIAQLDLVIMTDTAVAHLCGALGRPVWVLLSYGCFWLWLLERDDSPWYPSMRLFRQRIWGDWGSAFDAASAALLDLALARPAAR